MKEKPKVKEKKDSFDFMKANKDNIKNIIRDDSVLPIINDIVIRTNKIVIHAYNFIKLYFIHLYHKKKDIPLIDKDFICHVFKVITKRKCNSGGYTEDNMPEQLKELTQFYKKHYKKTIDKNEELYYDKMSYILAYEAIDIEKNINNNVQEHFIQHLFKFVNISFNVKETIDEINKEKISKEEKKLKKNAFYKEIRLVKNDLIGLEELKSDKKYHKWIKKHKKFIQPDKTEFDKNSIPYDLKSNTQDYLKPFMYIGIQLEKIYDKIDKSNKKRDEDNKIKQIRLFNVLPLRTNIIPKNITIDTCALIQNFLGDEPTSKHLKNYKKGDNQFNLWNRFFKLNKRVFKKNKYAFHFMIKTDAISSSIMFIRLNKNGKPMKKNNKRNKQEANVSYIEKTEITEEMKKKKFVCIDPNMSDIIYCGLKDEQGKLQTFRYTQNQRRLETRTKKYSKIIDTTNKETKIEDKSIKEIETTLSDYNSKTNNYKKFVSYLTMKNKVNIQLFDHYIQTFFRKFKLNRFINTQKSESKMIKNFINKYGQPNDVIVILGDYDRGNHIMKGCEPTILKKIRRIFRNAGFKVYLINEFRTSKTCNGCHGELEKFMKRKSNKPKDIKKQKEVIVNGLLRCTNVKQKCELIHNRDKNAVQNMLFILETVLKTGERPKIFTRETND